MKLKELEDEWEQVDATPPVPTRYTRSQQKKIAEAPPPANDGGGAENDAPGKFQLVYGLFQSLFFCH